MSALVRRKGFVVLANRYLIEGNCLAAESARVKAMGQNVSAVLLVSCSFAALVATLAIGERSSAAQGHTILDKIVAQTPLGEARLTGAASPCLAALAVAWGAQIPMGCEGPDSPARDASSGESPRRSFTGLTVRDALQTIVHAYNGFQWQDLEGVPVIRPIAAVRRHAHFLNQTLPALTFGTEGGVVEAFEVISELAGQGRLSPPTSIDRAPFKVVFPGGTLLDLLNAIARSHGQLAWHIDYAIPGRANDYMDSHFHLELLVSHQDGLGAVLPRRFVARGGS